MLLLQSPEVLVIAFTHTHTRMSVEWRLYESGEPWKYAGALRYFVPSISLSFSLDRYFSFECI